MYRVLPERPTYWFAVGHDIGQANARTQFERPGNDCHEAILLKSEFRVLGADFFNEIYFPIYEAISLKQVSY